MFQESVRILANVRDSAATVFDESGSVKLIAGGVFTPEGRDALRTSQERLATVYGFGICDFKPENVGLRVYKSADGSLRLLAFVYFDLDQGIHLGSSSWAEPDDFQRLNEEGYLTR